MAITGAVAAAIRRDNPYGDLIAMGARFIGDPGGLRTGGRPYYWLDGRAYRRFRDIPGAVIQRNSEAWSFDQGSRLWRRTAPGEARETPATGLGVEESRQNKVTINNANPISTAGITGAAVTLAADQGSAIAAEGLSELVSGGVVFKIDNSASGVGTTAIISGAVGNTQLHTLSAWIWGGSGSLRIASSVVAATFAASASPRRVSGSAVPLDSLAAFRIQVVAGQVV